MPGKRRFEEQITALDNLRQLAAENCVSPLRKALTHPNNFVAAKAADLVRGFQLVQLIPELLAAFDRFFDNAIKSDPQCWAKNSLSRALAAFEHQDAEVFLRGMRHIQPEPSWGGEFGLRPNSARDLRSGARTMPPLAGKRAVGASGRAAGDKDKTVRVEAVRAIGRSVAPLRPVVCHRPYPPGRSSRIPA